MRLLRYLPLLFLLGLTQSGHAIDLRLDFSGPLTTVEGAPVTDGPAGTVVTLSRMATAALMNEEVPPDEKARRFALAMKIAASPDNVVLSIDDIGRLKKAIEKTPTLVFGRLMEKIDAAKQVQP